MKALAKIFLKSTPINPTIGAGWIGVDVGSAAIKCAQVERSGSQWRLVGSLVIPASGTLSLAGASGPDNRFGRELRARLIASGSFTGRNVACVLPMSVTDVRTMELPAGSDEELREMIEQEFDVAAGDEPQDRAFDFWHTNRRGENPALQQVDVLSMPRTLARNLGDSLIRAGLRCHVLDGLPFSLARAVQMAARDETASVAAIDWGSQSTTFCICRGGQPLFTRSLKDCGLSGIMDRVKVGLDVTEVEAMQLLSTYGVPTRTAAPPGELQQIIGEFVSEGFGRLLEELRRTLSFLRHQHGSLFPQRVFLFGGGAAVRNSAPAVSAGIGLPVEPWELSATRRTSGRNERSDAALLGPAAALSALAYLR